VWTIKLYTHTFNTTIKLSIRTSIYLFIEYYDGAYDSMCVNTSACCKTLHPAKSANKFARSALTLPIKYDDNNDGCDVKR